MQCQSCNDLGYRVRYRVDDTQAKGYRPEEIPCECSLVCKNCGQKGFVSSIGTIHTDGYHRCGNGTTRFQAVRA